MKKTILLLFGNFILIFFGNAQTFKVDTLQYHGDTKKYINLVILGDGYTSSEQITFVNDAKSLSQYLLAQAPWKNYTGYFNVFAIEVISIESGCKHPNNASDCSSASPQVPVSNPNTYFGSSFDAYGIHRLLVPSGTNTIGNVLFSNFLNYDQVFVVCNSTYYGGSGGTYAVSSKATASNEITSHEIGHSFAKLGDEYYAGDVYSAEKANMTKETNSTLVKWKNWMGINNIGIYQHCCGGNSALWYRPHNSCKMRYLNYEYCSVCAQAIIENIHSLSDPIVSFSPTSGIVNSPNQILDFKLTELMKPSPNTLKIVWKLNTKIISTNYDSIKINQTTLQNGTHNLVVTVVDTSSLLKVDNHSTIHFSSVSWTINKTSTNISIQSKNNKLNCQVYPNPANENLTVSLEVDKKCAGKIEIITSQGKIVSLISNKIFEKGTYSISKNIQNLAPGTYSISLTLDKVVYTEKFIKN